MNTLQFKPLFPATNEKDLLLKMTQILGTPTQITWNEGLQLAKKMNYQFASSTGISLDTIIPDASKEAISMLNDMLNWDPNSRPTAQKLLQHPFFQNFPINMRITTPEKEKKKNSNKEIKYQKEKILMNSSKNNFANDFKKKNSNSSIKEVSNNTNNQYNIYDIENNTNIDKGLFSQIKQKEESNLQCK